MLGGLFLYVAANTTSVVAKIPYQSEASVRKKAVPLQTTDYIPQSQNRVKKKKRI